MKIEYKETNGTSYHAETAPAVVEALERARLNGQRVRIFLGDVATGKAWAEEHDVCGTISRSMGPLKVPLLIATSRSHGGGAILDHCVVAIATGPNRFAYKHASFDVGQFDARGSDLPEYAAAVFRDGQVHARFKTSLAAIRYADFMRGARMTA